MRTIPVETFEDAAERFPGIEQLDPRAIGKFVFFSAGNFPEELYKSEVDPPDDEFDRRFIPREEWKSEVSRLLSNIKMWREDREHASGITRIELAKKAEEEIVLAKETTELIERVAIADPDTGFDDAADYLEKWGFEVDIDLGPSPMFPEGRGIKKPAASYVDREKRQAWFPYSSHISRGGLAGSDRSYLNNDVQEYLEKGHSILRVRSRIDEALSQMESLDNEELEKLRLQYGAKAANLLTLERVLSKFYETVGEDGITKIEIPAFIPIAVDMFEAWPDDPDNYAAMLEEARKAAVGLVDKSSGGLVAIRSSAVYTEDGENHTGAGIYKSVAVDPNDPKAFAEGIETVYQSISSPDAIAYQASCGVAAESMGLLLQAYIESERAHDPETYGFINSRGVNPNLIEAHTSEGTLLFDKHKLAADLMLELWRADTNNYLHLTPDHSRDVRMVPHQIIEAVHTTILAEMMFQSPIQIEYVAGNKVVQVRPLPSKAFEGDASIEFPEGLQEIARTKAVGAGDLTLKELDTRDNNGDREGFVVFWTEYAFTDVFTRTHAGPGALPEKGAVVIVNHSDSGHIQTLCQERGLLCFYPASEADESDEVQLYFEEHSGRRRYDESEPLKLRFVADGYDGRIYQPD